MRSDGTLHGDVGSGTFLLEDTGGEKEVSTFDVNSCAAAGKTSFRKAWKQRPCLIPMSGCYEWKGARGSRQPYATASMKSRRFRVCGLWDRVCIKNSPLDSSTELATAANELVREVHILMPMNSDQSMAANWVTSPLPGREEMIQNHDPADIYVQRVSSAVGNVKNRGEHLAAPIDGTSRRTAGTTA